MAKDWKWIEKKEEISKVLSYHDIPVSDNTIRAYLLGSSDTMIKMQKRLERLKSDG